MAGPLEGVRVVEVAVMVAGPSAGGILADWGADVVKIEPPAGDAARTTGGGRRGGSNPMFELDNRAKRSIVVDPYDGEGQRRALELIDHADVFLSNLRVSGLARMGFGHEQLLQRNPRLVYALITGYGLEGPEAGKGAYDLGAWYARGGVAGRLIQSGGNPPPMPSGIGDHTAGITGAAMVSAALFERERTGRGQLVTTSLLRLGVFAVGIEMQRTLMSGVEPEPTVRAKPQMCLWNCYRAGDGRWFWLIGLEEARHWPKLLRIIEKPDWETDPRYGTAEARAGHTAELVAELDAIFASRPLDEWALAFDAETDFFWAPVNTLQDLIEDPQVVASDAFVRVPDGAEGTVMVSTPVDFHGTRSVPRAMAPLLGQHTDELEETIAAWTKQSRTR